MTTLFKSNARQKAIDKNVAKRQALKVKWDRHCKYSADEVDTLPNQVTLYTAEVEANLASNEDNWVRMLDEGVVVDGDGEVYAVIKKGALKSYYDNLPDSFSGYIDRDHVRSIRLGEYTKNEMRLVPLGDERYGIDINVKLDKDYYATRDLIRQNEHRAVSVEMMTDVDEFALASKVTGEKQRWDYLVPLIGAVDIIGYAVCENPKNANSIKDDLLDKASVEGDNMNEEELKALEAEKAAAEAEAEVAEEKTEEADNAPAEPAATAAGAPDVEASAEEPAEADAEPEAPAEGEGKVEAPAEDAEAVEAGLEQLEAAINELRAENAELKNKIAELENQKAAKAEVKMSTADRISKLLEFAKGAEATAAEGAKVELSSDNAKSKFADDDALWDEAAKSLNY